MKRFFHQLILQSPDGKLWSPDYPAAFASQSSKLASNVNPVTQASAASLVNAITYFITKFSGTNAITGFALPSGYRGIFVLIPTGAFTMATGGAYASDGITDSIPIGVAMTAVANVPILMVTDGLLCYPITGLTAS